MCTIAAPIAATMLGEYSCADSNRFNAAVCMQQEPSRAPLLQVCYVNEERGECVGLLFSLEITWRA